MKVFFENISEEIRVPSEEPLESALEQALDIFDNLPEDDGSSFGLLNDNEISIQFFKLNKFLWLVEIPDSNRKGVYRAMVNKSKCIKLITAFFSDRDPFEICSFEFEPDL